MRDRLNQLIMWHNVCGEIGRLFSVIRQLAAVIIVVIHNINQQYLNSSISMIYHQYFQFHFYYIPSVLSVPFLWYTISTFSSISMIYHQFLNSSISMIYHQYLNSSIFMIYHQYLNSSISMINHQFLKSYTSMIYHQYLNSSISMIYHQFLNSFISMIYHQYVQFHFYDKPPVLK